MKHNTFKRTIILFGITFLFDANGFTQIQGGVFDQKGQGLPNAIIIATDSTGNIIDSVRSDKRGFYAFMHLTKGKYKIEAKIAGFLPRVYNNIEVIKEESHAVTNERNDISSATRLEIILRPVKVPK